MTASLFSGHTGGHEGGASVFTSAIAFMK
jgi:hypothetical protein